MNALTVQNLHHKCDGETGTNGQENNSRDNTDLTKLYNNYYDNYICACRCLLYSIYNLHSIPVLHNFYNSSSGCSALIKYIDTVWLQSCA